MTLCRVRLLVSVTIIQVSVSSIRWCRRYVTLFLSLLCSYALCCCFEMLCVALALWDLSVLCVALVLWQHCMLSYLS